MPIIEAGGQLLLRGQSRDESQPAGGPLLAYALPHARGWTLRTRTTSLEVPTKEAVLALMRRMDVPAEHSVSFTRLADGDTGWACTCGATGVARYSYRAERAADEHVRAWQLLGGQ